MALLNGQILLLWIELLLLVAVVWVSCCWRLQVSLLLLLLEQSVEHAPFLVRRTMVVVVVAIAVVAIVVTALEWFHPMTMLGSDLVAIKRTRLVPESDRSLRSALAQLLLLKLLLRVFVCGRVRVSARPSSERGALRQREREGAYLALERSAINLLLVTGAASCRPSGRLKRVGRARSCPQLLLLAS